MTDDTNPESQTSTENQAPTVQNSQTDAEALAAVKAGKAPAATTTQPTETKPGDANALAAASAADALAATTAATAAQTLADAEALKASGVTKPGGADDDALGTAAAVVTKTDDGKTKGETPAKGEAPDSYSDFDLPDGIEMNKSFMDKFGPVYKELGLTQEQAQALITAQVGYVQEGEKGRTEQAEELHNTWLNEAKADKDIGGEKFDATLKAANLAVNKFGGTELKQLLRSTGIGNRLEIIRVFSKIGSLLTEDVPGDVKLKVVGENLTALQIMYPDDQPKSAATG